MRVSEHTPEEATFDEFWSKLSGIDKAINEKEFIPSVKNATLLKSISSTSSIWALHYTFPPPVSSRLFTILQANYLDEEARTGIIVSIPVDVSSDAELVKLEGKGVRGRYVSVEYLKELEGGKVIWQMATSSNPGGNLPSFLVDSSIPSQISADVPHFFKWFRTVRSSKPQQHQ